jgi:vacuolar protein sorting-associated protein 13A/C
MTTFTDGGVPATPASPDTPLGEAPPPLADSDRLRVKVKLTSIIAVLNEDGFRLATLSLSAADVSVMLKSPTMRVAARLGNLTFVDDFSTGEPQEMLSIQGDELADFRYETYDPDDPLTYPGHDTLAYLRTGSLQFTFVEEPVQRLLSFFAKFARMKAVYDAATQAAVDRATEMQTKIPKMHFDILIRTPIVVFPRDEAGSKDVLIANLGEISLSNRFVVSEDQVVTEIEAGLKDIRLTSRLWHGGEEHALQLLNDVHFGLHMTQAQMVDPSKEQEQPATQVSPRRSLLSSSSY